MAAFMSEGLVGAADETGKVLGMSSVFIGVVFLAIVGGAAESISAISMAAKNKMDLSIGTLVEIFMKKVEPMSLDILETDKSSAADDGSPLQRWTVIVVLSVTLLLWLTSPIHKLGAAAVPAIPLVILPLTQIVKGRRYPRDGLGHASTCRGWFVVRHCTSNYRAFGFIC